MKDKSMSGFPRRATNSESIFPTTHSTLTNPVTYGSAWHRYGMKASRDVSDENESILCGHQGLQLDTKT